MDNYLVCRILFARLERNALEASLNGMRHHIRVLFVVCANLIAYISFLELLNGVLRHLTGILGWGTTDVQASKRFFSLECFE